MKNKNKGFTLIEILIVIGIIAILATVVLVALNPSRQFAQAHDSQRTSNVNTILNSIGQRIADNKGLFRATSDAVCLATMDIPVASVDEANAARICKTGSTVTTCPLVSTQVTLDMRPCLSPTYVAEVPVDPITGAIACTTVACAEGYDTGYVVWKDGNGRVTVKALGAELSQTILVTR